MTAQALIHNIEKFPELAMFPEGMSELAYISAAFL